jgi:hypothetical protein
VGKLLAKPSESQPKKVSQPTRDRNQPKDQVIHKTVGTHFSQKLWLK